MLTTGKIEIGPLLKGLIPFVTKCLPMRSLQGYFDRYKNYSFESELFSNQRSLTLTR